MPGIELPDERRFLFLALIFTLALGYVYYFQPSPPFVERFEQAYHDVYWNRPLVKTTHDGPAVGIIAPRYISSLVDTEMWLWVQNTTGQPITPTIVITQSTMVWPPVDDVADAPTPIPLPAGQPPPTPTPRPVGTPVNAQVLMREGEGRSALHTDSRTTVHFASLMPGETAARLLWTRIMPIAQLSVTGKNAQGEDENLLPVYLYDSDISLGEVTFTYALWLEDDETPITLEQNDDEPPTTINSRQAVIRGFVRTLLLPPWSNGLLVGLALICAFIVNGLVAIFEQRVLERQEAHRVALERGAAPAAHPQPVYPSRHWEALQIVVRSHPFVWVTQLLFWAAAILAGIALTVALAERMVLCPLVAAGQALGGATVCPLWPAGTYFIRLGLLALFFFYCGYLANDLTPGSLRNHLLHLWHRLSYVRPSPDDDPPSGGRDDLITEADEEPVEVAVGEQRIIITPPLQRFTRAEKGRATRLSNEAGDLLAECDALLPGLGLEEIRQRSARLRQALVDMRAKAAGLPPVLWNAKPGAAHLRALERKLDGVDAYVTAADRATGPLQAAAQGNEAATALRQMQDELRNNPALAEEPARRLADELIQRLEDALQEHHHRFVRPWQDVNDDAALVKALNDIQSAPSESQLVRFFTSAEPTDNDHDVMPARRALAIGRARLQNYRQQRLAKQEARFDDIHNKRKDDLLDDDQARQQYQTLLNDIRDWPNALPGWDRFPPDDPAALAGRVRQLRDRVFGEI